MQKINHLLRRSYRAFGTKNLIDFMPEAPLTCATQKTNVPRARPSAAVKEQNAYIKKQARCHGCGKKDDWSVDAEVMTPTEAIKEASRCYKCVDPPC